MGTLTGYSVFCKTHPQFCAAHEATTREAPPFPLTPEDLETLRAVNAKWNKQIISTPDPKLYAVEERWEGSTTVGDCEEYAIAKKMELLSRGWDASQLLYTVVADPKSKDVKVKHLILVVRTSIGNLILDNLREDITFWELSGYPLHSRQRSDNPSLWVNDDFS